MEERIKEIAEKEYAELMKTTKEKELAEKKQILAEEEQKQSLKKQKEMEKAMAQQKEKMAQEIKMLTEIDSLLSNSKKSGEIASLLKSQDTNLGDLVTKIKALSNEQANEQKKQSIEKKKATVP